MAKYDPDRIAETAEPLAPGASGVEPTCDEYGRLILPLSSGGATSAKQDDLLAKFTDGTVDNNIGSAVSKTVKSAAGRLLGFTVRHTDASALYFWLFDNTSATGTQLLIPFLVPASGQIFIGTDLLTTKGIAFSTGLTYGLSTSGSSYSAYGTAANVFVSTVYS